MQMYRLLGTLNTQLQRKSLVESLVSSGWRLTLTDEDENALTHKNIRLTIEGEGTMLLDASFKGTPEDVLFFLECLDNDDIHYSLDLFGDSARLVRRFIK